MGVGGLRLAPAILLQGNGTGTGGWVVTRAALVRMRKISPPLGFDPADRLVRSKSLY